MSFIKTVFRKTWHLFLSVIRFLRRTLFCRRKRRESGMLLPLTVNYLAPATKETTDLHDWNSWDDNDKNASSMSAPLLPETDHRFQTTTDIFNKQNNLEDDDFFKDMVPQIRKPKKIIVKNLQENNEKPTSNRLAMDPRAFPIQGGELGIIDDSPSRWGEAENVEDDWDADSLLKEKRIADREKRIAEHQRRKLEKENKQAAKLAAANTSLSNSFYTSETNDRTKYS